MKIKKISLTNFRSFRETQSIDLAPVTLLFGPNSVGKSSVLLGIAYVHEILRRGNCNPETLECLGGKSVGGFPALVNGLDIKKNIKVRLDYSADKTPFVSYSHEVEEMAKHISDSKDLVYLTMKDFGGNIESGAVEFEIAWSIRENTAYIKKYSVWTNEIFVGCISSQGSTSESYITELNSQHPLLTPISHDLDQAVTEVPAEDAISPEDFHNEFEITLNSMNPNSIGTTYKEAAESDGSFSRIAPIAVKCLNGALPILGKPLGLNLDGQELDEIDKHFNFLIAQSVLSQAFALPLDNILNHLNSSALIGPLRIVPNNDYAQNPNPRNNEWFNGATAWDKLLLDPFKSPIAKRLLRETSEWFSSEDKLNTGYEIVNRSLSEGLDNTNSVPFAHILSKRHLFFRDLKNGTFLRASQLGTGISQILPIVVAANDEQLTFISVEQPELHIHPRLQVELGDLFLNCREKHSFLIETHSEHLILRLLRRVREGNTNNVDSIRPDELSIVYLTQGNDGVEAIRLHVTQDGDFDADWPDGFFEEREGELF